MGLETLRTAERAAGFAMVEEDPTRETAPKPDEGRKIGTPALLLNEQASASASKSEAFADWVKHVFGVRSGRAPA